MTSPDRARELGRAFEHIQRARIVLGVAHIVLCICTMFVVRFAIDTGKVNDWWYAPIRAMHLGRLPLFSLPWVITVGSFVLPPLPYFASWVRIKDSILEQTSGAKYWLSLITYSCGLILVSAASDFAYVLAIRPPLNLLALNALIIGTSIAFLTLASAVEFVFTGEAGEF
jgi:hypothetical protein